MYKWRSMTPAQQAEILRLRQKLARPWHSPPHWDSNCSLYYLVSAACYEHKQIAGKTPGRLAHLEKLLLTICQKHASETVAWCILPNHYHLLLRTDQMQELRGQLGRTHGRLSRQWNLEDDCPGRKVWFNCVERVIKSKGHYWATINYIHHNPVKHEFADNWQQWPFSSAGQYLKEIGRERAAEIWKTYPILDYGKGWDPS